MTKLYPICTLGKGQLYMMPKPDSDNLQEDIQFYVHQGVDMVVSLLLPEEIEKHGLQNQARVCQKNGISYLNFPIKDMDVPEQKALLDLLRPLKEEIEAGRSITFHCHGGRGRAGTAAISLMLLCGYELEEALSVARAGRQDPMVPVCDIQNAFLETLSKKLQMDVE